MAKSISADIFVRNPHCQKKLGKNFIQFVCKEFLGSSFGYRNPILDNTDVGSIWKLMMAFIFCEWSATKKELYPLWSFHIFLFYVSFL